MPRPGKAVRVGITGVPGVGKSTAIDALGNLLTAAGPQGRGAGRRSRARPAPAARSSATRPAWRGSPPTRTPSSAPRPSSGTLGGVAAKTRETMLLCEAAGLRRRAGRDGRRRPVRDGGRRPDRLLPRADAARRRRRAAGHQEGHPRARRHDRRQQGRRRQRARAPAAAAEYRAALHIITPASPTWTPPVVTVSGLTGQGLDALWAKGARPSRAADGDRRTRRQAPRPGRQVDVGARPRAHARAARRRARARKRMRRSSAPSPGARCRRPPGRTRSRRCWGFDARRCDARPGG